MFNQPVILAAAAGLLLGLANAAHARHVTHPVTPQNMEQQPFAFTVGIKEADPPIKASDKPAAEKAAVKIVEINVRPKAGKLRPRPAARGSLTVGQLDKAAPAIPDLTTVRHADGSLTFNFRINPKDLERAHFTYTESSEGPFPVPGDYWVFDLKEFAGK